MELSAQKKLNAHIFRLLKVNEIVIPIGRTNNGNLGVKFQANSDDFEIYLDAVPLSTKDILQDDNNIELKKMIEKYWFDSKIVNVMEMVHNPRKIAASIDASFLVPKIVRKRGRPKKVV